MILKDLDNVVLDPGQVLILRANKVVSCEVHEAMYRHVERMKEQGLRVILIPSPHYDVMTCQVREAESADEVSCEDQQAARREIEAQFVAMYSDGRIVQYRDPNDPSMPWTDIHPITNPHTFDFQQNEYRRVPK